MSGSYLLSVVHADTPYEVYTAVPMSSAGTVTLQYTVPSSTNAVLNVTAVYGGSVLTLRPWYTTTTTYQPTTATTTICDKETDNYRYGYNGKLKDNEWAGIGNSMDYGARMQDTRTGRFRSVDPLTTKFPWWSPYQFAGNDPIAFIDIDGLEPAKNTPNYGKNIMIGIVNQNSLKNSFLNDPNSYALIARNNNNWISGASGTDLAACAKFLTNFKSKNPNVKIHNLVLAEHGGVTPNNQSVLFYGNNPTHGSTEYITAVEINKYRNNQTDGMSSEVKQAIENLKQIVNSVEPKGNLYLSVCNTAYNNLDLGQAISSLADHKINVFLTPDKVMGGRNGTNFPELDRRSIAEGLEYNHDNSKAINFDQKKNEIINDYREGFYEIPAGEGSQPIKLDKNIKYQSQGAPVIMVSPTK